VCDQRESDDGLNMAEILVRKAVSPDIELLSKFEHAVKTDCVWQMMQQNDAGKITTSFTDTRLPREMRLTYPRSPDFLLERWNSYSVVLVACMHKVPVGYAALNGSFSEKLLWVRDLVVDELWRRKAVATTLIQSVNDWGKPRGYSKIILEMSSKNFPGISLAKKCGFDYAGFNDSYFNNNDIALFFTRMIK
jgi:GNAT superfamily N-acetyltransferase